MLEQPHHSYLEAIIGNVYAELHAVEIPHDNSMNLHYNCIFPQEIQIVEEEDVFGDLENLFQVTKENIHKLSTIGRVS